MPAEVKSGKVRQEFSLSASLKTRLKRRANQQSKSVGQYLRDLVQADLKPKKTPKKK